MGNTKTSELVSSRITLKDSVLGAMAQGHSYTAQDFSALGAKGSINKSLSRLHSEGSVQRIGYGNYALSRNNAKLVTNSDALVNRVELGSKMGMTFGGLRDVFKALGYKRTIGYLDYWHLYKRGSIAARVIEAPVRATWRSGPVVEVEDNDKWNEAWNDIWSEHKLLHFIMRADKLSRIGRYSVLFIGINDGKAFDQPVDEKADNEILYITPFSEHDAVVKTFVSETNDKRFGLVDTYQIDFNGDLTLKAGRTLLAKKIVHHSRVVHIAENLLTDNVYGAPTLERIFNVFEDLLKVVGGNSEAFWKVVDRGMAFILDKDAPLDPESAKDFEDEIQRYTHGLDRTMKLQGMKIQTFGESPADPRGAFEVLISLIAGAAEIPKRILLGSERGSLASSQDEKNFNANIIVRRDEFAEPMVLMPLIEIFTRVGALPKLKDKQKVKYTWPDLTAPSTKEQSDIAKTVAKAIRDIAAAIQPKEGEVALITRDEGRSLLATFIDFDKIEKDFGKQTPIKGKEPEEKPKEEKKPTKKAEEK